MSCVYVLKVTSKERFGGQTIYKVGWSGYDDPTKRVNNICAGLTPFVQSCYVVTKLICEDPGSAMNLENIIHRCLKKSRIDGEYFDIPGSVISFLSMSILSISDRHMRMFNLCRDIDHVVSVLRYVFDGDVSVVDERLLTNVQKSDKKKLIKERDTVSKRGTVSIPIDNRVKSLSFDDVTSIRKEHLKRLKDGDDNVYDLVRDMKKIYNVDTIHIERAALYTGNDDLLGIV